MEEQKLTVRGYTFRTSEDAKLAKAEAKKIDYIEERLNYKKADNVLMVYKKILEEKTFQTPVGISYMEKLYDFLINSPDIIEEIPPIPLQNYFSKTVREQPVSVRQRVKPVEKKVTLKMKYRISVMFNILLVLMVAAMFAIAMNAKSPNIINYEKVLKNKYAEWEQELNEKDRLLRERELELDVRESE